MIGYGHRDRTGRPIGLCEVDGDNWRAVADLAPLDEQRVHTAALGARYLLLSHYEEVWTSLAVPAGDATAGHVMWGLDEDGSHWIGGLLIDATEQRKGIGAAAVRTLTGWLAAQDGCWAIRLSYHPDNVAAARLYASAGFRRTDLVEGDEVVDELSPPAGHRGGHRASGGRRGSLMSGHGPAARGAGSPLRTARAFQLGVRHRPLPRLRLAA